MARVRQAPLDRSEPIAWTAGTGLVTGHEIVIDRCAPIARPRPAVVAYPSGGAIARGLPNGSVPRPERGRIR